MIPAVFDLSGRVALVTGSTRGLGLATSRCLAQLGATVAINGRKPDEVEARCAEIVAAGGRAIPACFDVTDEAAMTRHVTGIAEQAGSLDILVANAAWWLVKPIEDISTDEFHSNLDTKLRSAFTAARLVTPLMKQRRWGRIVFMASISVAATSGRAPVDAAGQGALAALARALSSRFAAWNITCNAVAPGYIKTDMTQFQHESEEFNTWLVDRTPARRWGRPEEIGWTVAFLASDAASFITGQTIIADGGMTTSV